MTTAYLNGDYLPLAKACVPAMDRGFLFSDGVYEVIPIYEGKPFRLQAHLARLDRSLAAIHLDVAVEDTIVAELLRRNGIRHHQYVYIQVTRGPAPKRDYRFPATVQPTVFAYVQAYAPPEGPATAITLPDIRWEYCHIKSTALLGSVLQRQKATEEGADEAILIRQGYVIEGTASNVFLVKDGVIRTAPQTPHRLGGITREVVLEIAAQQNMAYREEHIPEEALYGADEIWITSSLREVQAVLRLNQQPVGNGKPGPVWQHMRRYFRALHAAN